MNCSTTTKSIHMHQRSQQQSKRANNNYTIANGGNPPILASGYRKTSAEIVSEAKTLLAGGTGGARLVTTRRPITPREPRRQLYGKLAPAGRPPSAFSLRYLQFESRALPSLQPIQQPHSYVDETPIVHRSGSIGTLLDYVDANSNSNSNGGSSTGSSNGTNNANYGRLQGKLPALLSPPKITASLDNLSEAMPAHPDLMRTFNSERDSSEQNDDGNNNSRENDIGENIYENGENSTTNESGDMAKVISNTMTGKEQMLRSRQSRSFDAPSSQSAEVIDIKDNNNSAITKFEHSSGASVGDGSFNGTVNGLNVAANGSRSTEAAIGTGNSFLSKIRLIRSNDLLAQSTTETLLDMLKAHSGIKDCTEETVQHINAILIELYTRVKGAKGSWRSAVLGGLYGLVECSSPKILLAVARVVLALCVTGSNLTGACKLVFKVARNESNDYLFAESDVPELLIDGLGRASPIDEPEACIYGYGAVRFLASAAQSSSANGIGGGNSTTSTKTSSSQIKQKSIAHRLARHGAVQLMVLHLQILNEFGAVQKLCGPPLHALYQLSAALRALAGLPQIAGGSANAQKRLAADQTEVFPVIRETIETQEINLELACPHLVKATEISIGEPEVQANIVRTLSVLSEHEKCCATLSEFSARIGILLGPCSELINGVPEKPLALLSRLGYILGNIMARFDSARTQFYNNDVAMEYLIDVLELYSNQKLTIHNQMGDTVIDVIIKLVRVVANMSVNHDVGLGLGTKPPLGDILLHLLNTANNSKASKLSSEMEEMLLATLGALHNLCFYQDNIEEQLMRNEMAGSMCERMSDLSVALCTTLSSGPEAARPEAARVLGNMTTNPVARNSFCGAGGLKVIVQCLVSNDYELVATASGVLVNLLGDCDRRAPFQQLKGPVVLRNVLQKSTSHEDWLLAGIVCQALWNFLIDTGNVILALGEHEAHYIANDLAEYLDETKIFNGEPPDNLWEQFAAVATDLLERIHSSVSIGNSPVGSSDEDHLNADTRQMPAGKFGRKWTDDFSGWMQQ